MERLEPLTVGELLGIDPDAVAGVGLYAAGTEPVSSPRSTSGSRAHRTRRGDLDVFLRDCEAGASDADLARAAGRSVAQVRRWRLAHGIRHAVGPRPAQTRATALAVAVFGAPFEPVITRVKSVVDGRFEPPEYLVREKLDYSVFIRCIRTLRDGGYTASALASGLGVREADIDRAEKIARRT